MFGPPRDIDRGVIGSVLVLAPLFGQPYAGSLLAVITGVELIIAPLLVAGSTLACRWWDAGIGGLISAFPAVAGPVL